MAHAREYCKAFQCTLHGRLSDQEITELERLFSIAQVEHRGPQPWRDDNPDRRSLARRMKER